MLAIASLSRKIAPFFRGRTLWHIEEVLAGPIGEIVRTAETGGIILFFEILDRSHFKIRIVDSLH